VKSCLAISARRMGGAQRYPSIAVREVDGFREGLNPSYALSARQAQAKAIAIRWRALRFSRRRIGAG
jgi:hypothetical protein